VIKDAMPLVESKYRVAPAARIAQCGALDGRRAVDHGGIPPPGSVQRHRAFSAAIQGDFEKMFPQVLANPRTPTRS